MTRRIILVAVMAAFLWCFATGGCAQPARWVLEQMSGSDPVGQIVVDGPDGERVLWTRRGGRS